MLVRVELGVERWWGLNLRQSVREQESLTLEILLFGVDFLATPDLEIRARVVKRIADFNHHLARYGLYQGMIQKPDS